MQDFMTVETTNFPHEGSNHTPAHHYSEFKFKTYAPIAFRYFRDLFGIQPDDFLMSMCSAPLRELSNPGASGSIFYLTNDDEFIIKTVQHKEGEFLQKLLPGYYLNLDQNPRTLLPKFFGLYCYQCNSKNVRLVAMNNLLPSSVKLHQKYDLKGSTYKRKASKTERQKQSPTYKDLDFMEHHSEGIFLEADTYTALTRTMQRDCRVLESFKIMDYSLLVGIHNLDEAQREKTEARNRIESGQSDDDAEGEPKKSGLNRTRSEQAKMDFGAQVKRTQSINRQRLVAHSTAMESIQAESEPIDEEEDVPPGGIPARNARGERLLLFLGIIDILQSYRLRKKLEHTWKSMIHDGDTVSVHRPSFYAQRFLDFMAKTVFKKIPSSLKHSPSKRKSIAKPSRPQEDIDTPGGASSSGVASVKAVSLSDVTAHITPTSVTSPVSTAAKVTVSSAKTSVPTEPDVAFPAVLKGSQKQRVPPPVPPRGSPKAKRGGGNSQTSVETKGEYLNINLSVSDIPSQTPITSSDDDISFFGHDFKYKPAACSVSSISQLPVKIAASNAYLNYADEGDSITERAHITKDLSSQSSMMASFDIQKILREHLDSGDYNDTSFTESSSEEKLVTHDIKDRIKPGMTQDVKEGLSKSTSEINKGIGTTIKEIKDTPKPVVSQEVKGEQLKGLPEMNKGMATTTNEIKDVPKPVVTQEVKEGQLKGPSEINKGIATTTKEIKDVPKLVVTQEVKGEQLKGPSGIDKGIATATKDIPKPLVTQEVKGGQLKGPPEVSKGISTATKDKSKPVVTQEVKGGQLKGPPEVSKGIATATKDIKDIPKPAVTQEVKGGQLKGPSEVGKGIATATKGIKDISKPVAAQVVKGGQLKGPSEVGKGIATATKGIKDISKPVAAQVVKTEELKMPSERNEDITTTIKVETKSVITQEVKVMQSKTPPEVNKGVATTIKHEHKPAIAEEAKGKQSKSPSEFVKGFSTAKQEMKGEHRNVVTEEVRGRHSKSPSEFIRGIATTIGDKFSKKTPSSVDEKTSVHNVKSSDLISAAKTFKRTSRLDKEMNLQSGIDTIKTEPKVEDKEKPGIISGITKKLNINQSKKEKASHEKKSKPKVEIRTYTEGRLKGGMTKDEVVCHKKAKSRIDMFQKQIWKVQSDSENSSRRSSFSSTQETKKPMDLEKSIAKDTKKIFEPIEFTYESTSSVDRKHFCLKTTAVQPIVAKSISGNVHEKIKQFSETPIHMTPNKIPRQKKKGSLKKKNEKKKILLMKKDIEETAASLSCCSTPPPPFEEAPPPRTSRTNSSSTTSSSASGRRRGASSAASVMTTSSASSLALTPAALSSAKSNEASVCWTPPASVEGSTPTWTEGTPSFTESSSSEQGYPITPARSEGGRSPRPPPPPARIAPPTTINCLTSEVVEITHLTSETSRITISTYEVQQHMESEDKYC
ncbi:hypothetical protein O3G_MSEX003796 [Manduca sexta]|nr:hypothetical protein O3G_MSEX003796 [Manduca sexta]